MDAARQISEQTFVDKISDLSGLDRYINKMDIIMAADEKISVKSEAIDEIISQIREMLEKSQGENKKVLQISNPELDLAFKFVITSDKRIFFTTTNFQKESFVLDFIKEYPNRFKQKFIQLFNDKKTTKKIF